MRIALALALLVALQAPRESGLPFHGVVTDPSGRPLADVTVLPAGEKTASDGTFGYSQNDDRLRFVRDGYRPATVLANRLDRPVILQPAAEAPARIPVCPDALRQGTGELRVPTPEGMWPEFVGYDHAFIHTWRRGEDSLQHTTGHPVTDGLPLASQIAELEDIYDRDVRLVIDGNGDFPITDFRGRSRGGGRLRFIGTPLEFYEYGASVENAAVFDRMLDAMCWDPGRPVQGAVSEGLAVAGAVKTPLALTRGDLFQMARTSVTLDDHGKKQVYAGVLVSEILARAGGPIGAELKGGALATYVLASAADGYQVLFSIGELDPALSGSEIMVADTVDGDLLSDTQGPLRIVVPRDKRGARSVRMLRRLEVVRLPASANALTPKPH